MKIGRLNKLLVGLVVVALVSSYGSVGLAADEVTARQIRQLQQNVRKLAALPSPDDSQKRQLEIAKKTLENAINDRKAAATERKASRAAARTAARAKAKALASMKRNDVAVAEKNARVAEVNKNAAEKRLIPQIEAAKTKSSAAKTAAIETELKNLDARTSEMLKNENEVNRLKLSEMDAEEEKANKKAAKAEAKVAVLEKRLKTAQQAENSAVARFVETREAFKQSPAGKAEARRAAFRAGVEGAKEGVKSLVKAVVTAPSRAIEAVQNAKAEKAAQAKDAAQRPIIERNLAERAKAESEKANATAKAARESVSNQALEHGQRVQAAVQAAKPIVQPEASHPVATAPGTATRPTTAAAETPAQAQARIAKKPLPAEPAITRPNKPVPTTPGTAPAAHQPAVVTHTAPTAVGEHPVAPPKPSGLKAVKPKVAKVAKPAAVAEPHIAEPVKAKRPVSTASTTKEPGVKPALPPKPVKGRK